jgi:hypothetical protein
MMTVTHPVEHPHVLTARGRASKNGRFNIKVYCKNCGEWYGWSNLLSFVVVELFVLRDRAFIVTKVPAGVLVMAHKHGHAYAYFALHTLQFEDPCPGKRVL